MTYKSSVVINKEGKWYVAQSLELGVVSQGRSIEEAQRNLKEAIELYLEDQPQLKRKLSGTEISPLLTSIELKRA